MFIGLLDFVSSIISLLSLGFLSTDLGFKFLKKEIEYKIKNN